MNPSPKHSVRLPLISDKQAFATEFWDDFIDCRDLRHLRYMPDRVSTITKDHFEKVCLINHYLNQSLWKFEDKARDPKANDSTIAHVKRCIDKLNQKRNDQIEIINLYIIEKLEKINHKAPLFSETPGSLIDRLSILNLKIFYMQKQIFSEGLTDRQVKDCSQKLFVFHSQRNDLRIALKHMMKEIEAGRMRFKNYFQYKMYNDDSLNPYIRQARALT